MATVRELATKRKNILLNMKTEEIEALYNEINKKAIDSLGTVKNNFTFDYDEIIKANEELTETNSILINKYPYIEALGISSRLSLLVDKYEELTTEAKELEYTLVLLAFSSFVEALRTNLTYLKSILNKFYFRYSFRTRNLDSFLLDELGVPEDIVLETLEPYIYYNNNFYSKSIEKDFNYFIEMLVGNIASDIANINPYLNVNIDPSGFKEEGTIKIVEEIIQLQLLATNLIKQYNEVKANPFEKAIDVEATVKAESLNNLVTDSKFKTTVEKEKEFLLIKAPSYNFETFELIVPDIDLKELSKKILKESSEKYKGVVNNG